MWAKVMLVLWSALVLYAPTLRIGAVHFRLDYPLLAGLVVWLLLQRKWGLSTGIAGIIVLVVGAIGSIGTLNGIYLGYAPGVSMLGILKFFVSVMVMSQFLRHADIEYIMRLYAALGVPAALLAILQVTVPELVAGLTVNWYASRARTPTSILFGSDGSFNRAVAVFESPVYAATAFLLLMICAWIAVASTRKRSARLFFLCALSLYLLAGLGTTSSTFILGATFLFISWALRVVWKVPIRSWITVLAVGPILVSLVLFVGSYVLRSEVRDQLYYQLYKIVSGNILTSRFGADGILRETWTRWPEYFVFGIGGTEPPYFVGDNLLVTLWVRIGLLGVMVFLALSMISMWGFIHRWQTTPVFGLLTMLLVVLLAGLGAPTISIPRISELVAFVFACGLAYVSSTTKLANAVGFMSDEGATK